MIKNMRIPRYKTPITIPRADSEISDGTQPAYVDSEARMEVNLYSTQRAPRRWFRRGGHVHRSFRNGHRGFLQKEIFTARGYKNRILPEALIGILCHFDETGVPDLTPIGLRYKMLYKNRHNRIYNEIIVNPFQVSKTLITIQETAGHDTSHNLGLPAGGIRRPHLRRLTRWGRRRCGSAWSLAVIRPPRPPGKMEV